MVLLTHPFKFGDQLVSIYLGCWSGAALCPSVWVVVASNDNSVHSSTCVTTELPQQEIFPWRVQISSHLQPTPVAAVVRHCPAMEPHSDQRDGILCIRAAAVFPSAILFAMDQLHWSTTPFMALEVVARAADNAGASLLMTTDSGLRVGVEMDCDRLLLVDPCTLAVLSDDERHDAEQALNAGAFEVRVDGLASYRPPQELEALPRSLVVWSELISAQQMRRAH